MKLQLTVLAVTCLCFFACKKDRTCTCTETRKGTSTTTGKISMELLPGFSMPLADTSFVTNVVDIRTYDRKMTKVSKRTANSNCVSYSEPYKEVMPTSVPASSFNLSVVVVNEGERSFDCELK